MAEYADREHYIPLRKSDLCELLCKDPKMGLTDQQPFRQFCRLVGSVWHFEYLETLDKLKDEYAPFDPDSTCRPLKPLPLDKREKKMEQLFDDFVKLMERANFKRMSKKDVEAAVEGGASDWGINMDVDFSVYDRLELFCRGEGMVKRTKKHFLFFWKKEEKKVDCYSRLVLMVKLKKHKRIPEHVNTDGVFMKTFKDIPKLDLEMILPGTKMQMPFTQKVKLGGSAAGTIGYGIYSLFGKLVVAVKAVIAGATTFMFGSVEFALLAPFGVLFGYGWKQYAGYQVTRQTYAKMLTQILDEAEEQECRETILAYFYLWKYAPPEGWTGPQLDDYVEMELEGKLNLKVDFEIDDALAKLEKLNIVKKTGDRYHAVGLEKALEMLDYRWDNYFKYNNPEYEAPPVV